MYYEASITGPPGPKKAAANLYKVVGIDSKPRSAKVCLTKLILQMKWAPSKEEALTKAERWETQVISFVNEATKMDDRFGRPNLVICNSSSSDFFQGAGFLEGTEDESTREHKLRRKNIHKVWEHIKAFTDKEFEDFCAKFVILLGADDVNRTKYVGDEGLDFYGKLKLREHIWQEDRNPTVQSQLDIWIIGQAKHYKELKVATPDIRNLVGAVELARGKAFGSISKDAKYPDLNIRICDPIFRMFLTTGDISANGWQLLQASGVVGMDGLMLSAAICDRSVGRKEGLFNKDSFNKWLYA